MAAGNGRHAQEGARGRARVWIVLAALLLLLCTGTVMLALSDPQEDAAEETARSGDSNESAPGGPRAWDGSVRAATRVRRPIPAEPPGVNPRGEPWGVRTDVATTAEAGAAPSEPEQESETGGGRHGPNAAAAHSSAARGATTSRRTPDGAVPVELVVTVTAAESDKRLGGADVIVVQGDAAAIVLRTRPDGTVHVPLLAGHAYVLDVKARGRLRVRRSGVPPSDGTARQSVALERGVVVHGFVSDDERRLRGAVVRAVALNAMRASIPFGPEPPTIEETTTARDGSYVLDCIPRGLACVLEVEAGGHAMDRAPVDAQPDPDYDVRRDFLLSRDVGFVGRLTGPDRKPVDGAMVYAFHLDDLALLARKPLRMDRSDWLECAMLEQLRGAATGDDPNWHMWLWRTATRKDGSFAVVVPDHFDSVFLLAMHHEGGRSVPAEVELPGRATSDLALRGRVRAEFSVLTQKGRPAEEMTLEPYLPWERWTAPARGPGRYGFADTVDGVMFVDVAGPAGAPGTYVGRRHDADSVRWNLLLDDGDTWRGDVSDERGTAIVGATLTAGPRTGTSGERGVFEMVGVHPYTTQLVATATGHLRATVEIDGKVSGRIPVTVPREANVRLELALPRRAQPPTWYRVSRGVDLIGENEDAWEDRFEWKDGVVEVSGWGLRDETCFVFVPGYQVVVQPAKARAGTKLDLGKIELVEQAVVEGVVVDEHGRRVRGARVEGRPLGSEWWIAIVPMRGADSDDDGTFSIGLPLSERSYELVVSAPDYPATPQIVGPSRANPLTVVIGRSRDFLGRWTASEGRAARALILGPHDVVYADVLVAKDGTFRAEIPRQAQSVRIVSITRTRDLAQRVVVPADFAEGAIFEIR